MSFLNGDHKDGISVDKIILEIVRALQPITTEDICLELGENLDNETKVDVSKLESHLNKIKNLEKFDLISAGNKKGAFWKTKE